ncbi:J domain-containing protein [uncultured Pontibacter sp.]|uniref:J domain-containing protein n=1 Tax=uncultured Pontibacter sp. TaxID=453356 RepID=UPI00261E4307|nr:J domain-containing protein [uncultured Pontibacter sp.]
MPKSDKLARQFTPQIATPENNRLTELQQQFNQKVKQIDHLKQEIAARHASINQAQRRIEKELRPLIRQVTEKRVELARLLDEAYTLPFFKKRESEKLALLIADIAQELIERYGREDMLHLYNKYAASPYEASINRHEQHTPNEAEDIFKDIFGDNADAETGSLDDFEDIQAQLDREMEQREREKQNRQKSRKTKAQLAKEAQAKAELSNISKASRKLYTELAKQLHPDKEQNETARAWKEEAMKRVTLAYHHDDFFELLRLQAEFMQEQGPTLQKLPDAQLEYYIKMLTDQTNSLQAELQRFSTGPDAAFYTSFCGSPKQMDHKFKAAKEDLNMELQSLKQNLRDLQDPQLIRMLLK